MKKILFAIIMVMAAVVVADAAKKAPASISFEEKTYDFGSIREDGGTVSHDFYFTNSGDGNLVIVDATAQCGCTVPEYPENPIASGKRNKIKVTYNPLHRPGGFEKVVNVRTNGKPSKVSLKIKGVVIPAKNK